MLTLLLVPVLSTANKDLMDCKAKTSLKTTTFKLIDKLHLGSQRHQNHISFSCNHNITIQMKVKGVCDLY